MSPNTPLVLESGRQLRRVQRAARDALRAVRALEAVTTVDVFGVYQIAAGEVVDHRQLADFVALAQNQCAGQDLEVYVIARESQPTAAKTGGRDA